MEKRNAAHAGPGSSNRARIEDAIDRVEAFMQARKDVRAWSHSDMHVEERHVSFVVRIGRIDGTEAYETLRVRPDGTVRKAGR